MTSNERECHRLDGVTDRDESHRMDGGKGIIDHGKIHGKIVPEDWRATSPTAVTVL